MQKDNSRTFDSLKNTIYKTSHVIPFSNSLSSWSTSTNLCQSNFAPHFQVILSLEIASSAVPIVCNEPHQLSAAVKRQPLTANALVKSPKPLPLWHPESIACDWMAFAVVDRTEDTNYNIITIKWRYSNTCGSILAMSSKATALEKTECFGAV